ncbi:hypothetical protein J7M07_08225, partial [bacterium]|nr:hypothetical protein [bacterium]
LVTGRWSKVMMCGKQILVFIAIFPAVMLLPPGGIVKTEEFNVKKMAREENTYSVDKLTKEIEEIAKMLNEFTGLTENAGTKEWGKNLFYPLVVENELKGNGVGADDSAGDGELEFVLRGIFIGKEESFAFINGEMVSEGDMVSEMRVEEISLNRVVLKLGKLKKELFFDK